MSLPINPETTVGALLENYPELEETLIEMSPAFANLRNPVVRRTVAKVATLDMAARIGGVGLPALLQRLREVAGQTALALPVQPRRDDGGDSSWLMAGRVVEEIDADAMLERGAHPLGKIREAVGALGPGEVVLLRSSFRPQPLIETLRQAGTAVRSSILGRTHFTWFGGTSR